MTHHITSTTDADLGTALRNWFEAWHADVQAHLARNREQLAALTQGVPHVPT